MIKISAIKALVGNIDFKIVVVAVLYLTASQLAMWQVFPGIGNYPLWAPSGVALALIILLGYRIWPGILIGSLITYTIIFITQGIQLSSNAVVAISCISIANVIEALVGYKLYNLFMSNDSTPYEKTSNTFIFLSITLFISLIGSVTYTLGINSFLPPVHVLDSKQFILNYLAELTGLWLFTNLIISWSKGKTHWKLSWWSATEAVLYISAIGMILLVMNRQDLPVAFERSFPFLVIPFLLWIAFRSSIQIATLVVVTISLFSIYITNHNTGPFVLTNSQDSLLLLQLFILVVAVTIVILSAAVYERLEAKKSLNYLMKTWK